ncbi:MAG: complex I NDUFA9 subunit family protein [Desulfuromonadaceae bacterium]|nr:complex I NDUFA9 subunit family protein [Desulfuromonadaceae bacterium]MDD5104080.1 complex I NDUFA9 subunit family protein [Desulfuromonadaceae bacterium]
MRIFVAGGTGFVGEYLVRELLANGHSIRLLVHGRSIITEGVERIPGDVTSRKSFAPALEGCDAVINLVGIIREFPLRGITFARLHQQATANLLTAAADNGVRRYLQMSALGTRPGAVSAYHRTKWQAEQAVRDCSREWTIFRPSLIFGPHDSFINMLARQMRLAQVMPVIGSGSYRLQPIHADDVARCFARALILPETVGQTYELCGADRLSYEELLDLIAAALGRPKPWKPHLPLELMKLAIPLLQNIPQFPITRDQLQMLLEENIGGDEWQKVFGFTPRGVREGIAEYLSKA